MTTRTRGIVISTLVHVIIIVLLIIFGFSTPLPLPDEEGIVINFGTDDRGSGQFEPKRATPAMSKPVSESIPEKSEEKPITQDFEEAPSLPPAKEEPKPKQEKPKEIKPQEEVEKEVEQPKPVEEKPREVDRRTLFPGQKADGDNTGEGITGNQGNQGDPKGSVDSNSREGGTVGGGDKPTFSLGGRNALSLPHPEYPKQKSGRVVVEVTVDKNGNVTSVRGGVRGSTTYDSDLITAAENAARKAKFDVSANAPAFQTGTITYVFKLQQ